MRLFHQYGISFSGFINRSVKRGLRLRAFNIFFRALLLLKFYLNNRVDTVSFVFFVLNRLRPWLYFQISKFKPTITYSPRVLSYNQSLNMAYRWFFNSFRSRLGYSSVLKFFLELVYIAYNKSNSVSSRKQAHLLAFDYKKNLRMQRRNSVIKKIS